MGDDLWQLASCVAVVAASMLDQISSSVTDTKACGTGWLSVAAVQSLSRVDSLRPHGLQHARPPCPSPSPGICSDSCPLS